MGFGRADNPHSFLLGYPPPATCWSRHRDWTSNGIFRVAWDRLLSRLLQRRGICWEEAIGDGSFARAKKGGDDMGRCHRGNGTRILLLTDGQGIPLSAYTTAANHSEVTTIETLIDQCPPHGKPRSLLYDKAADADWLRQHLQARGIELICPRRQNRTRPRLQDGRSFRRYERRYRIERTFSWLQDCRRLITRWEYYAELFEGFVHLACL